MLSKRYSRKEAERLLAYRHSRINDLYITLVDPPVHIWHLSLAEAVEMLTPYYKIAGRMTAMQLQHKLNLKAKPLQRGRMYVFIHVEGADLPNFPEHHANPEAHTEYWLEHNSHMRNWYKLRETLLGI